MVITVQNETKTETTTEKRLCGSNATGTGGRAMEVVSCASGEGNNDPNDRVDAIGGQSSLDMADDSSLDADHYSAAFDEIMESIETGDDSDDESGFSNSFLSGRMYVSTPCISTVVQLKSFINSNLNSGDSRTNSPNRSMACLPDGKTNTAEPQPLTKTNVTMHDTIWHKQDAFQKKGETVLSPPLKGLGDAKTCDTLWRANVDILDNLSDSGSERSRSSMDTIILMTHGEKKRNRERIERSLLEFNTRQVNGLKTKQAISISDSSTRNNNECAMKGEKMSRKHKDFRARFTTLTNPRRVNLNGGSNEKSISLRNNSRGIVSNGVHINIQNSGNEASNDITASKNNDRDYPASCQVKHSQGVQPVQLRAAKNRTNSGTNSIPHLSKNNELRKSLRQKHAQLDSSLETMLQMLTTNSPLEDAVPSSNVTSSTPSPPDPDRLQIEGLSNKDIDALSSVVVGHRKKKKVPTATLR